MWSKASFVCTVKTGWLTVCKVSRYNINKAIEANNVKEPRVGEFISKQYHEIIGLFCTVLADQLAPH